MGAVKRGRMLLTDGIPLISRSSAEQGPAKVLDIPTVVIVLVFVPRVTEGSWRSRLFSAFLHCGTACLLGRTHSFQ